MARTGSIQTVDRVTGGEVGPKGSLNILFECAIRGRMRNLN